MRSVLERPLAISQQDLLPNSPVVEPKLAAGESSMTVRELCAAVIMQSDNTAANVLLAGIGGPAALTDFFRKSVGDDVTRFDRIEPALNSNLPGDPRDTTTPHAMVGSLLRIFTQDVLSLPSRAMLIDWMIGARTGLERVRAGIPKGWQVGDKTGTGHNGAVNNVVIAYPPERRPIFIAVYMSESKKTNAELISAHADIGRIVAGEKMAMKKLIHGLGITLFAIAGPTFADCAPEKLIRMVTQNVTPGIPADSFAVKPKVMYRLGNGRTRLEEQPDPVDGVQLLIITDAPRIWHIDLVSRTGETMVDDSIPPKVVYCFLGGRVAKGSPGDQIGCELQFMKDSATTHESTKSGSGTKHFIRSGK